MGTGRRGILVAVMALVLALNNGAFAALAFIGVDAQSNSNAATTPPASLSESTTKIVSPDTTSYNTHTHQNGDPGGATPTKTVTISSPSTTVLFGNVQIKLPNTSTLESEPAFPSPAILLLLALLGQGILLTLVLRRWRND